MKKKPILLVLKGIPACGKSTYAKELVTQGWKRVNKDDLRTMIDCGKWSRSNERIINFIEATTVKNLILNGHDVVVDDTNFAWESEWKDIAETSGADFEVKFFDVPVMECIERDAKRGEKSVGAKVIMGMWNQYVRAKAPEHNPNLSNCYIVDIDGTLAHTTNRSPYDYTKVYDDATDKPIKDIINVLHEDTKIVVVSGREDSCYDETRRWLVDNGIKFDDLMMRTTGDKRNDAIVKQEIYEQFIKNNYNVLAVFDDRNRIVDMWRSIGLKCLQVDYGFF